MLHVQESLSLAWKCVCRFLAAPGNWDRRAGVGAAAAEAWQSSWSRCRGWMGELRSFLGSELSPRAGICPAPSAQPQGIYITCGERSPVLSHHVLLQEMTVPGPSAGPAVSC